MLCRISIPVTDWLWPAAVFLVLAVLLMLWSHRHARHIGPVHRLLFCLKLIGIAVLALCLLEPLWIGSKARSGANIFAVVADNSSGMNIRDPGSDLTRGETLHAELTKENNQWLTKLGDNFQLRRYIFDSRLRRTGDFSELIFDGSATAIGTTLDAIATRYKGTPLAGILLMTDGNATDMTEQEPDYSAFPPVYPVLIGTELTAKDIAISNVTVTETSFEDTPILIQADLAATGYAGRTVTLDLTDNLHNLVERQEIKISENEKTQSIRFRFRPDKSGILFYRLNAAESKKELTAEDQTQIQTPEATTANNRHTVMVDRGKGPYRILYVTGRPNWEYKFLRRAVEDDRQIQIVGLIRVARREPKYNWLGHAGEETNPLYRGYDSNPKEQVEEYDKPVIVRLNTRDDNELIDGFPKTKEQLHDFHAIILDDVDTDYFTHDQMDLVRWFVTERGGGFIMLGGKDSFGQGKFHRTPIGSILPVYLDNLPDALPSGDVKLSLTRQGWLMPWARLRQDDNLEQQRIDEMSAFAVLNRVGAVKAGARVVATVKDQSNQTYPALVVQRFGNGRTGAVTIGDIWRWGLKTPETRQDMDKFWRQTLRWLVADVPQPISIDAKRNPDRINQPVTLGVNVRDKSFEPVSNVSVKIEVKDPENNTVVLNAEPSLDQSGLYEATYIPRSTGGYFAKATVTDAEGLESGIAETGWTVDLQAREFESIKTNRPLLEKLAARTGGQVIEMDKLSDFADDLPHRNVPVTVAWVKPLWDLPGILPLVFFFTIACFLTEWALRRWKGLP